jgi:hypothetical protein
MPNKFARTNGKNVIVTATFTAPGNYNPAGGVGLLTRTITFPCKSIRSINDVQLKCAVGYTIVPVVVALNTVQFRVYKTQLNYTQAGGGNALTTALAGQHVLERAAGALDDPVSPVPVELALGHAITVTVNGTAIGSV